MPFVEVFSPPGAVSAEQRKQIAEHLVPEVMKAEGAPDNEFARAISWLVWHEGTLWSIGGQIIEADEPPRYVVRVTVPAASQNDATRAAIVKAVTEVLADADEDPDRVRNGLASFVLLNEVPEGDWGSMGRIFSFKEIASFVLTGDPGLLDDEEVRQRLGLAKGGVREPATTGV